jgi:ComF family protein
MSLLLELLFPPKCILCGKVLDGGEIDLCRDCRINAPECPADKGKIQFLDSWTPVWYYEKNVRSSLLRYKFGGRRHYAKAYGRILAMKLLENHPEGFDVLTWVPVSCLRKFRRGYDQVELLAKAVGEALGMEPVRLLKKIRNNPPQSGIVGQAKRRANVLGIYRAVHMEAIQNKRILLLDDILTTGATAGECARVLLTAGADQVHCGVVAAARNRK